MELIGWMHCKVRPNNGSDVFKDSGGGGACICVCGRPSADEDLHRNRCRRRQYEAFHARARDLRVDAEEVSEGGGGGGDPAVEEIFEGFLAIGTLGVGSWPIEEEDEAAIEEAQKESVELVVARAALETIAEKEAEATTETDLMVVETELEKVLAAEAERDGGRRSSAARSSHSGSSSACPLQGFLFGSSSEVAGAIEAEVADAAVAAGSYRKERRQSLAELFMMSRIAEEAAGRAKAAAAAPGVGSAVNWEEKATTDTRLLNKRTQKCSGWKGSDDADAADGSTPETKIQKVLQMFHRKVHPQNSTTTRRSCKTAKIEKKHYLPLIGANVMKLKDERRKEITENSSGSGMNVDQGHWIKTDANYVVLEL